jgi:hypothetical protein
MRWAGESLKIRRWQFLLVVMVAVVFGAIIEYMGGTFEKILPEGPLEFEAYRESMGLPSRGTNIYQRWLLNQWLEAHPSYSGPDVEAWKEAELERRLKCLESLTRDYTLRSSCP